MAVRNEANFLAEWADAPDDLEVLPGLTVGAGRAFLARPSEDPPGTRFIPSVEYSAAAGETGQMAIYARTNSAERAPIVAFVHGGAWSTGHHYGEIRFTHRLAQHGYVAATLTYRLSGEAPWPASLEDTKCAIRWLRSHAEELGGDPDRIVICGGSAGGQLSAMTALTPGEYEGDGGCDAVGSEVQGAFLISPAVDPEALVSELGFQAAAEYFGGDIAAASPVNRIGGSCPPITTITGDADVVVPVTHVERFHNALADGGAVERLIVLPGRIHGFDIFPADFEISADELIAFLAVTVGSPAVTVAAEMS